MKYEGLQQVYGGREGHEFSYGSVTAEGKSESMIMTMGLAGFTVKGNNMQDEGKKFHGITKVSIGGPVTQPVCITSLSPPKVP